MNLFLYSQFCTNMQLDCIFVQLFSVNIAMLLDLKDNSIKSMSIRRGSVRDLPQVLIYKLNHTACLERLNALAHAIRHPFDRILSSTMI